MNILLFSFVFLVLTLPTTENAMRRSTKKYLRYDDVPSEISLDELDINEKNIDRTIVNYESSTSEKNTDWETLSQESSDNNDISVINQFHFFTLLPNELIIDMFLTITLNNFFALLKTDKLRYTLASKTLIQRFLLEERYTKNLSKHIPTHLNTFPIEGQAEILNLSMLLITAAKAGYTDDFRVLFNHPTFFINISSEEATALLTTAVESEQIGIIKQLIIIKKKITTEKLEEIITSCENKDIKKLLKKKKNPKVYTFVKMILYPYH